MLNLADKVSLLKSTLGPGVPSLRRCLMMHNYHWDCSVLGSVLGTLVLSCNLAETIALFGKRREKWLPLVLSGTEKLGVRYSAPCFWMTEDMSLIWDDSFSDVCSSSLTPCSFPVLFLREEHTRSRWASPLHEHLIVEWKVTGQASLLDLDAISLEF